MESWSTTRPDPADRVIAEEVDRRRRVISLFLACTFGLMAAASIPLARFLQVPALRSLTGLSRAGQPVARPWGGIGSVPSFGGRVPVAGDLFGLLPRIPGPSGPVSLGPIPSPGGEQNPPPSDPSEPPDPGPPPIATCDRVCHGPQETSTKRPRLRAEVAAFKQVKAELDRARRHAEGSGELRRLSREHTELLRVRETLLRKVLELRAMERAHLGHQAER